MNKQMKNIILHSGTKHTYFIIHDGKFILVNIPPSVLGIAKVYQIPMGMYMEYVLRRQQVDIVLELAINEFFTILLGQYNKAKLKRVFGKKEIKPNDIMIKLQTSVKNIGLETIKKEMRNISSFLGENMDRNDLNNANFVEGEELEN